MIKNKKFIIGISVIVGVIIISGFLSGFLIKFKNSDDIEQKKKDLVKVLYVNERMNGRNRFNAYAIEYAEIPKELVRGNIIVSLDNIVTSSKDYCIKSDIFVPKNSLFYNDYLIYCDDIEEDLNTKLDDGYYMYELNYDLKTSVINDNDYVTVTLSKKGEDNLQIRKEYIRGIPVLQVKSSKSLLVMVNEEVYNYLQMASFIEDVNIEVAKSKNKSDKYIIKDSELKDYVLDNFEN